MKKILLGIALALTTLVANAYQLYTPAGVVDVGYSNLEGVKKTYSAVIPAFTPATTATDMVVLTGAAGKVVTVTDVRISGTSTGGTYTGIYMYKRTALNTGGTSTAVTTTTHDSSDASPSATVVKYTANPSGLGTGTVFRADVVPLPSGASGSFVRAWEFGERAAKALRLKSASESLAINFNGAAVPAGTSLFIAIEWTEE